ncbi:MAG: hypothetical protein HC772_00595 [Leptolyngbyaceae cyanobacterium CRU_2_3]|nr:hypothetical protein [Leptolyngbyaceae cyanobacterium CRU_2_3]
MAGLNMAGLSLQVRTSFLTILLAIVAFAASLCVLMFCSKPFYLDWDMMKATGADRSAECQ